jgi:hypothetical protein
MLDIEAYRITLVATPMPECPETDNQSQINNLFHGRLGTWETDEKEEEEEKEREAEEGVDASDKSGPESSADRYGVLFRTPKRRRFGARSAASITRRSKWTANGSHSILMMTTRTPGCKLDKIRLEHENDYM